MSSALLDLLDPPFPLLFKGILPEKKKFEMTKYKLSRECAVCERPFSVFFWMIDRIPFKTSICQICAKSANVCQVSLLDLDFGIPVIVRNKLLHLEQEDYKSSARRWYNNRLIEKKIENGEEWMENDIKSMTAKIDPAILARARQLVESDPYLSFKKAPVCAEWLKNECKHGQSCYYSHSLPDPGEHSPDLSKFGVRCRYLGTVDPNGKTIVERLLSIDQNAFTAPIQAVQTETEQESDTEEALNTESTRNTKKLPIMTLPTYYPRPNQNPPPYEFIKDTSQYKLAHLVDGHLVID